MRTYIIVIFLLFICIRGNCQYSYKKFINEVKSKNKGYDFYLGDENHIVHNGDTLFLKSGQISIFGSLTIERNALIRIEGDNDWWNKQRKWCILVIKEDMVIEGNIEAINWKFPKIQNLEIREEFTSPTDGCHNKFHLNHLYVFGNGGHGAKGSNVREDIRNSNTNQVSGGLGKSGNFLFGGGGGSGAGLNGNCITGHEGIGAMDHIGAADYKPGYPGGKGGNGGQTPDFGVGGLIFIWGQNNLRVIPTPFEHKYINVCGQTGNAGANGGNCTEVQSYKTGCGGGGAGSAGLPAGAIIIEHFHNIELNENRCNLNGGEKGNKGKNGTEQYLDGVLKENEPTDADDGAYGCFKSKESK